jgi:hypothetical protein
METVLETIDSREVEIPQPSPVDKPAELTVPAEIVGAWAAVPVRNPARPLACVILASVLFVAILLGFFRLVGQLSF